MRFAQSSSCPTALAALLALVAVFPATVLAGQKPSLDVLLAEIQRTLIRVQELAEEENFPPLESVELDLKTTLARTAGGKLAFFVISIGAEASNESVQDLKIVLTPPTAAAKTKVAEQHFSEDLAQAIVDAARSVHAARLWNPPLDLQTLQATLSFVASVSGNAGAAITITPVTADLSGKLNSANTQTIVFSFKGH